MRTYFFEHPLECFVYLLYPWKFQTNESSTPRNCANLRYVPSWKFQDQKPKPLEIPHNFFLVSPEIPHAISLIPLEIPYP